MSNKVLNRRIPAVIMLAAIAICASGQTSVLLKQLADPTTTETARYEMLQKAKSDPQLLVELSQALPDMLLHAPNDPIKVPSDSVLRSEAQLAGALQIKSTIPALASLLGHPMWDPGGSSTSYRELRGDPVARALYEIGPAAYPALTETLRNGNLEARRRAANVLILADDKEANQILRGHLAAEPDPWLRESIRGNLERQTNAKP